MWHLCKMLDFVDRVITLWTHLTWQSKCSFCIKVFLQTLHIKFSCNLAFLHSQKALAFCQMVSYKCWLLIIWHFNNLAVFWSGYFSNGYLTSGVLSYGEFETGNISEQPKRFLGLLFAMLVFGSSSDVNGLKHSIILSMESKSFKSPVYKI